MIEVIKAADQIALFCRININMKKNYQFVQVRWGC